MKGAKTTAKSIKVKGFEYRFDGMKMVDFLVLISNDEKGKTISIANEEANIQFTIPFEPLEKHLR